MIAQPAQLFLRPEQRAGFAPTTRAPFEFDHGLSASPLLAIDALRDLTRYMEERRLSYHFEIARGGPASGWGSRPDQTTVLDAFDSLASGNALILLKSVHRHPDYSRLMKTFLAELGDILGVDMSKAFETPICTIILASPKRVTPYHMDDSHNFLMQVHGEKTFYVFDGSDPDIVSEQERHEFWSGNLNATVLTDAKQRKATTHALSPGRGVHVPLNYPHWALNGGQISVAVSINFREPHHRISELYGMNNLLRRKGFRPAAPGLHPRFDDVKVVAFRALLNAKRMQERARQWSHWPTGHESHQDARGKDRRLRRTSGAGLDLGGPGTDPSAQHRQRAASQDPWQSLGPFRQLRRGPEPSAAITSGQLRHARHRAVER